MKLSQLSLANYRGFEQLEIAFEPDITVIAGVNGVGKSSVLCAVTQLYSRILPRLSLSRAKSVPVSDDDIYSDAFEVSISAEFIIRNREWSATLSKRQNRAGRLAPVYPVEAIGVPQTRDIRDLKRDARRILQSLRSDQTPVTAPLAVFFSPKRQLPDRPRSLGRLETQGMATAYRGALSDREVQLREFMHWFRTQETLGTEEGSPRAAVLDSLRQVVSELVPEFTNLRIEESPRLGFVVEKEGKPFYLHQLSDGERGLLALVFDLTRRLAITNPGSRNPIREGAALVLIDELELHLHPKWQRDITKRLPAIFENCQFVMTTHSPQVIGEVEARCVRLLSIQNERVVSSTPGMAFGTDSNWILSVLMGADEMNEDVDQALERISSLISNRELEDAKSEIDTLRSRVGNTQSIQRLASTIERVERLGK